ncbi:MAG: dienelactone hydrolase family protein, partial [Pseudomonadota bacterium]|nr:dienelactone hydrolase family protein [Pseudomonadota bacterium]MEC7975562.1 dienelactone hydrolase family protein [Pseudomonadota bacterium]
MTNISIKSSDGFELGCYCATPEGSAKGAVVVIQEIFGVNSHIRDVADRYAHNGYNAYAPMLFDRVGRGIELGYEEADMDKGIDLAFNQLDLGLVLEDVQATVNQAASDGRVGLVGFCFGGLVSWLSAAQISGLSAVVGYYGGGIAGQLDK